jgi:hypothetical protein
VPPLALFRRDGSTWVRFYTDTNLQHAPASGTSLPTQPHRRSETTTAQAVALAANLMAPDAATGSSGSDASAYSTMEERFVTESGSTLVPAAMDRSVSGLFHLQPSLRGTRGKLAQCVICLHPMKPHEDLGGRSWMC